MLVLHPSAYLHMFETANPYEIIRLQTTKFEGRHEISNAIDVYVFEQPTIAILN